MHARRNFIIVLLLIVFAYMLFVHDGGGTIGYMIFDIPKLSLEVVNIETHVEFSENCYSTINGIVHNEGNGAADDVLIACSIIDDGGDSLGEKSHNSNQISGRASENFLLEIPTLCFPAMAGHRYKCSVECKNC